MSPAEQSETTEGRSPTVGLSVASVYPVFATVGERLERRGFTVRYFDPEQPVESAALDDLALFVSKTTRPRSVQTLVRAERRGVPTWNGATGVQVCSSRFTQLRALSSVGFRVPTTSRKRPDGEYVAKSLFQWGPPPTLGGEGAIYEELLETPPVDYKYYVVDDGSSYRARLLRVASKLHGEKRVLGETSPEEEHVQRIASLMGRLGLRAVGVDLLRTDDGWYAVDLNACPSFEGTGLEEALVDSIATCL